MPASRSIHSSFVGALAILAGISGPSVLAAANAPAAASVTEERTALERRVLATPGDRSAWLRLAQLHSAAGADAAAADAYDHALALSQDPRTLYNAACAHARAGHRDQAFTWLDQAAASGAIPVVQIDNDENLVSLRPERRFAEVRAKAQRAFEPCPHQAGARQFDFWLGEWEVRPNGAPNVVGHSRVEKILSGCVLLENWTGANGWSGKSFNIYAANEGRWHQTWVDQSGTLTHFLDGQWRDGALRFRTEPNLQGGQRVELRLTFHDLGPGKVRQHGQRSTDGGVTWQDQYDFIYERPGAPAAVKSTSVGETAQVDALARALGPEAQALGEQVGHGERTHGPLGVAGIDLLAVVRDGAGEDQLAPLQLGQGETLGIEAHVGEGCGVHRACTAGDDGADAASARNAGPQRAATASRP